MTRVAINGLGRIGRATLKILMDTRVDLVAANDIGAADNIAYLLKYDTVYGRYEKDCRSHGGCRLVDRRARLTLLCEQRPGPPAVEIVERGHRVRVHGQVHKPRRPRRAYPRRRTVRHPSAPSNDDDVDTIVHGVNTPQGGTDIISCASCTTNCITPVMEILGRRIGIKKAIMTTVHAYTASQAVVDSPHKHPRRGRAAAANLVPTSTGAAIATTKALPEYRGRFDGVAIRAPIAIGSLADIVAVAARPTTVDEVNQVSPRKPKANVTAALSA